MIHLDQLPCSSSVATNPVSNDMTGFMVVSKSTNELTIPGLEPHRINDPADANNTPAVTHDSSSHSSGMFQLSNFKLLLNIMRYASTV